MTFSSRQILPISRNVFTLLKNNKKCTEARVFRILNPQEERADNSFYNILTYTSSGSESRINSGSTLLQLTSFDSTSLRLFATENQEGPEILSFPKFIKQRTSQIHVIIVILIVNVYQHLWNHKLQKINTKNCTRLFKFQKMKSTFTH